MSAKKKRKDKEAKPRVKKPGRAKRIAYAAVIVLVCAILPFFANNAIGYVPLIFAVLFILTSYIYLRLTCNALKYEQRTNYFEWLRGENGMFSIDFENTSIFLLPRLELTFVVSDVLKQDYTETVVRTVLHGHEKQSLGLDLNFAHCGVYEAGLMRVEVFDLLGLFSKAVEYSGHCKIRVIPNIYPLSRIAISENTVSDDMRKTKATLSDDMDYAYVRDYAMGDPMKTVHWKLSSRFDEKMYTKLFESHNNPGIAVVYDFYCKDPDNQRLLEMYDTMLETSFSLINRAWHQGIETQLVFTDVNGMMRLTNKSRPEDLDPLIDDMQRLSGQVDPDETALMLDNFSKSTEAQSNIFLFTAEASQAVNDRLIRLKQRKKSVKVFAIIPKGMSDSERVARTRLFSVLESAQIPVVFMQEGEEIWKAGLK